MKNRVTDDDRCYLLLAISKAEENLEQGGGPFGAVIVREGRVIATAANRVVPDHDPTAHAEINAIRLAAGSLQSHQLADCTLYASCEPCPMCLGAIYWAGIGRVVYASDRYRAAAAGFSDNHIYEEISLDPDMRSVIMIRAMTAEGDHIFSRWEKFPDKIQY